jgi:integrase
MTPLRKRMLEELQLRNLSETTIQTYLRLVERFAKHFGESPAKLGPDHVRRYLLHLLNDRKDTWATVQVNRGALKFLYVRVLKQSWFDEEIAAPKRRPRLPTVMSPEEIARILDRTTNLKHWTILATFYATALRCNELRHLKLSDLDSHKMVLHVRQGKGGIARDIPLSPLCWSGCGSITAVASRRTGCSRLNSVGITRWTTTPSVRCAAMQEAGPASNIWFTRTCSATPAPPTCSTPAPTSAPSRFCWATRIFEPPPGICAYP